MSEQPVEVTLVQAATQRLTAAIQAGTWEQAAQAAETAAGLMESEAAAEALAGLGRGMRRRSVILAEIAAGS